MKNILLTATFSLLLMTSCGSSETAEYTADQMVANGDFLFEGPNTLQGSFLLTAENIAGQLSRETSKLSGVIPSALTITIPNDSIGSDIESFLVQVVSDELPLVTIGTISPLSAGTVQELATNKELDLLPYAKDPTSTLVVDTNLKNDKDELSVLVDLKLTINY